MFFCFLLLSLLVLKSDSLAPAASPGRQRRCSGRSFVFIHHHHQMNAASHCSSFTRNYYSTNAQAADDDDSSSSSISEYTSQPHENPPRRRVSTRQLPDLSNDNSDSSGRQQLLPRAQQQQHQPSAVVCDSAWRSRARRSVIAKGITAAAAVSCGWSSRPVECAASELANVGGGGGTLRPTTEEQPQIPFPDAKSLKQQDGILEGLLYLKNPRSERRPTASDVIVLTVRTFEQPDVILAGAKIPVSRIGSFPVRFQMTADNAVGAASLSSSSSSSAARKSASGNVSGRQQKQVWMQAMTTSDLIVKAVVCDREFALPSFGTIKDDASLTTAIAACRAVDGSPPITAEGIAKLVRLQQQQQQQGNDGDSSRATTTIRAPVSLPLE